MDEVLDSSQKTTRIKKLFPIWETLVFIFFIGIMLFIYFSMPSAHTEIYKAMMIAGPFLIVLAFLLVILLFIDRGLFAFLFFTSVILCISFFILKSNFNDSAIMLTGTFVSVIGIPLLAISLFINSISRKSKGKIWCMGILIMLSLPYAILYFIPLGAKIYKNNFSPNYEKIVELDEYRPFIEGSKVATLTESSTLKFQSAIDEPSKLLQLKSSEYLPKLHGELMLYPVYAAFVQAVYPENNYDFNSEIKFDDSNRAYVMLINRKADMIFVPATAPKLLSLAKERQVEMKFTPIGKETFVFFVSAKNPIDSLSTQQVRDIYSGKIVNWKQVGGDNQQIRAFQRTKFDVSFPAFIDFMQQASIMPSVKNNMFITVGITGAKNGLVERIRNYDNFNNSIGFSFRYFTNILIANNKVKLLKINGVYPSKETIRSGEYPLTSEFYAVTLADNPEPNVQKLLDWILSPQGQYLIEQTGYVGIGQL